jgi:hypothetical protein
MVDIAPVAAQHDRWCRPDARSRGIAQRHLLPTRESADMTAAGRWGPGPPPSPRPLHRPRAALRPARKPKVKAGPIVPPAPQ